MVRPSLRHPGANPFAGRDMPALLEDQARIRGDHPFLIWEPFEGSSQRWSYAEFAYDSACLAAGLAKRGIKKGDFVLIHLENCPEFLLAWFACARLGAVAVTTNTRSAGEELRYYADNASVRCAITQPKFADLIATNCPDLEWVAITASDAGTGPQMPQPPDMSFDALFADASDLPARAPDPTAPLCVMYTSGTTSRPKGVVWTHANGLWAARGSAIGEGLVPADIHHVVLPMFHMNAMSCQVLCTFWVGGTLVLQPRFSASRFWDVALRNKCSWGSIVPFCASALMEQDVPKHSFHWWGAGINGIYDAHFKLRSLGWWAMTETVTLGIIGSVRYEDTPMTMGRPTPGYEIAILNSEGQGVVPGESGELRVRALPGVSLFDGYLNNAEVTESSFDDQGFFITGDRCRLNEDGTITFQDRIKDMLKVGGENVAASEVERVITGVAGVAEVAVVAKPDRMLNEVPVAFVIAADGANKAALEGNIEDACIQSLADFKRPREIRIVEEFPRSNLEKIAKAKLRDQLVLEARSQ